MINTEQSPTQVGFEINQRLIESDLYAFHRLLNRLGIIRDVVLPKPNRKKNRRPRRLKRVNLTSNEAVDIGSRAVGEVYKKLNSHFNDQIVPDLIDYIIAYIKPKKQSANEDNDEEHDKKQANLEVLQSQLGDILHKPVYVDPNIFIFGYGVNTIIREYGGVSILAVNTDRQNGS